MGTWSLWEKYSCKLTKSFDPVFEFRAVAALITRYLVLSIINMVVASIIIIIMRF